jgi:hypothetical protein
LAGKNPGEEINPNYLWRTNSDAMELETLKDLYIHELKDLFSAERQLVKALPKMAKAANTELDAIEWSRGTLGSVKCPPMQSRALLRPVHQTF